MFVSRWCNLDGNHMDIDLLNYVGIPRKLRVDVNCGLLHAILLSLRCLSNIRTLQRMRKRGWLVWRSAKVKII